MITKQPTIEDIYNFDAFITTPGVRDGLLERANSGDPELTTHDTDDGPVVYYNAPHGEEVAVGRPIQLAMGGNVSGRHSDAPMSDIPMALLDMGAATVKGATQGFLGLPGDLESIAYGIKELFNRGGDESKLDAFIRGLQEQTILPKTEEVKKWLDENVGKVGDGKIPYESMGEVVAPGGYGKAVKGIGKSKKAATAIGVAVPSATAQDQEQK